MSSFSFLWNWHASNLAPRAGLCAVYLFRESETLISAAEGSRVGMLALLKHSSVGDGHSCAQR